MSPTDFARHWVSILRIILPKYLLDGLDAIYLNTLLLSERFPSLADVSPIGIVSSLRLQTLLPPLICILTIYFALVSIYRTTTFFLRSTVFLVKWGVMIGVTGAALGYIANAFMPNSLGLFSQSNTRRNPSRSRPRVWDTFDEHQRWRESQREDNPYAADAGKVARGMVEKFIDATEQVANQAGWWGTLSGLAANTFVGDNGVADPVKRKRRRKDAKGKGKSR